MGNKSSSAALQKELIEEYHRSTHYSKSEVKQLYKQFMAEAPGGVLNKADFSCLLLTMGIRDPFVTRMVFNAFDRNSTGSISFGDFVAGMSVITRGTPEEKAEFAFQVLDISRKGNVTREDVRRITKQLFAVVAEMDVPNLELGKDSDALADEVYTQLDPTKKGFLTPEEYKAAALKHPTILYAITLV
eukprot:GGOE01043111.1.p1 GENE.GGOE01043111.1~~GGOE01043111.1.p1  ORF type:complete len:216 (-),score=67.90 GGOE01043111.1:318-881(-)